MKIHVGKCWINELMKENTIARGVRNKMEEVMKNQIIRVMYLLKKTSLHRPNSR